MGERQLRTLQMQTFTLVGVKARTYSFLLQECIFFTLRLDILIFLLTLDWDILVHILRLQRLFHIYFS